MHWLEFKSEAHTAMHAGIWCRTDAALRSRHLAHLGYLLVSCGGFGIGPINPLDIL